MRTRAIVIRSVDYGDADRIVTFLTEEAGKISAVARGARRSKRRFAGALETACLIEIVVAQGRADLWRLTEARVAQSFPGVLADLRKLAAVGAAFELLRVVAIDGESDRRVFGATVELLNRLDRASEGLSEIAAAYQLRVLAVAGFAPGVDVCARSGRRPSPGQSALYDPRLGSIVSREEGGGSVRLSGRSREYVRVAQTKGWSQMPVPWTPPELGAIRRLIKAHCEEQLGQRLEAWGVVAEVEEISG